MADAIIVGAGIAGASAARALAERGMQVCVIEKHSAPAHGASGNPRAVLFPQLTKAWTPSSRFSFLAYAHMQRVLAREDFSGLAEQRGMIQLPRHEEDAEKFTKIHKALGLSEAIVQPMSQSAIQERIAPYQDEADGLYFPHGTALDIVGFCQRLLDHPAITCCYETPLSEITRDGDGWSATAEGQTITAPILVLCHASDITNHPLTAHYPLFWNRGQLCYIPHEMVHHAIDVILCQKGYVVPIETGYLVGATYDREYHGTDLRARDHSELIEQVRALLPGWLKEELDVTQLEGRASLRSVSQDRTPLIGPANDAEGNLLEGLYLSVGHGSRGALSAPLGAEYLADLITHHPVSCLPHSIQQALAPMRFVTRQKKQNTP